MVFWATVLAFVLGIMYYMVYPYDTKIKEVYLPASEAYIAGFLAQHQAAKDFAKEAVIAINNLTNTASKKSDSNNSILILSDADSEKSLIDNFLMPHISSVATASFQPAALNLEGKSSSEQGFVSVLLCLDMPERQFENGSGYVTSRLTDCREATTKYVMTYGPLPNDMSAPYLKGKIPLWEGALLKRTRGNPDCGFLYSDGERYYINNSKHLTRTVPSSFMRELKKGGYLYSASGKAGRVMADSGDDWAELMFCMTPVNDPYPRLGLKINLDGAVNALPPGNHSVSIPSGGWLNLVDENVSSGVPISGVGGENSWFVCSSSDCNQNENGFSFDKQRTVTLVPYAGKYASNKELFGMPFTISMMASFNSGTYNVFASQNVSGSSECTPTKESACVNAKYSNGVLIIEAIPLQGMRSVVSAIIPTQQLTQVDYIFNAGEQRLYVNGNLVQQQKFDEDNLVAYIEGDSFVLGGTGSNYTLYNFLVYNRSPETDKQGDGTFDLYGLPRVLHSNTTRYIKNR